MPPPATIAVDAFITCMGYNHKVSEHRGGGEGGQLCFSLWLDVVGVTRVAPDMREGTSERALERRQRKCN
jgi:hypothetical protein